MRSEGHRFAICGTAALALAMTGACDGAGGLTTATNALLAPHVPSITEPAMEGQVVSASDTHMETAPFADDDPADTHRCSDYEIWTVTPSERVWVTSCIGGPEKLHTHLGDGVFEGSHAGRRELLADTPYLFKVRHRDNSGDPATEWSGWAERGFRTAVEKPPVLGAGNWIIHQSGYQLELVATGFELPVNIAFVPNATRHPGTPLLYVTELYGTIKVVTGDEQVRDYATNLLNFDTTGAFPGSGEQGLAGIAVDGATGDVFASMLYAAPNGEHYPKVVRFHSTDGGMTAATATTILDMPGEAMGQSHQISNVTIGPDGNLYVHVGDGFIYQTGQDLNSFRGKVLRMGLDGSALTDNPFYDAADGITARDYVYSYGLRNPFGGAWKRADGLHYGVENGPTVDRFSRLLRGVNYGWAGTDESMRVNALYNWTPAHAPVNITFVEQGLFGGSGYPSTKMGHAFISESGPTWASGPQALGKRIVEFTFAPDGSTSGPHSFLEYNGTGKASVAALATGPDGLYFSDLYKDDETSTAIARGSNVYRVRYVGMETGGEGTGLAATYFDNVDLTGSFLARTDGVVDFDWSLGSPAVGMGEETFSVRWTGQIQPKYSETYTITARSDDGVRVWVNNVLLIDAWGPQALTDNSGTIALTAGVRYDIKVEYFEDGGAAVMKLLWQSASQSLEIVPQTQLFPTTSGEPLPPPPPPPPPPANPGDGTGTGLAVVYFDDMAFGGAQVARTDATVDFEWGQSSPAAGMGVDTFSARWTGQVQPRHSETYTFITRTDDGVRLWVNGQLIIDRWVNQAPVEHEGQIALTAGVRYDIKLEYFENGGGAVAQLFWRSASQARQIVPTTQLYPVADGSTPPPPTEPPPPPPPPPPAPGDGTGTGLVARYFPTMDLTGTSVDRTDARVDFEWGGGSPVAGIDVDRFSVRWTGHVQPRFSGTYTFVTRTDDGVRLWVNGQLLIDRWVNQAPVEHDGRIVLTAGVKYAIKLEYFENGGGAVAQLFWYSADQPRQIVPTSQLYPGVDAPPPTDPPPPPTDPTPPPTDPTPPPSTSTGLSAAYYDNLDFTGTTLTRVDQTIDFWWGDGAPATTFGVDTFSARWTGKITPRYSQTYTFTTRTDDGVRLWVNGQLIVDHWVNQAPVEHTGSITLAAGTAYDIKMEYFENGGGAVAQLFWSSASQPREIVPASRLTPATP